MWDISSLVPSSTLLCAQSYNQVSKHGVNKVTVDLSLSVKDELAVGPAQILYGSQKC
jgi:hypothetical protein